MKDDYSITIGAECVTLRKRGESHLRVGTILGREMADDVERVYVDRLLLAPGDRELGDGWSATGCISTILLRVKPRAPELEQDR